MKKYERIAQAILFSLTGIMLGINLLMIACQKDEIEDQQKNFSIHYEIEKGKHWASPFRMFSYDVDTLWTRVWFSPNCLYDESLLEHTGWNKLGYWSQGYNMHNNGVTFTWRCRDNHRLVVGWYGWQNGVSPMDVGLNNGHNGDIGEIQPAIPYLFGIARGDSVYFVVREALTGILVGEAKTKFNMMPVRVYPPYFGGNSTAPQDMKIIVEYMIK